MKRRSTSQNQESAQPRVLRGPLTGRALGATLLALGTALATGCAKPPPRKLPPIETESPRTEIMRIGMKWQSVMGDKGFRSEPSAIGVFQSQTRTLLTLPESGDTTRGTVLIRENFSMRDGSKFSCQSEGTRQATLRFARRPDSGEAAVEITQPELRLNRQCFPAGFPNPVLVLPAQTARFALQGDQLVAYEPKVDTRQFTPIQ